MLNTTKPFKSKKRKVAVDPKEQADRERRRLATKQLKAAKKRRTAALYKKLGITGSLEERERKLAEYCKKTRSEE